MTALRKLVSAAVSIPVRLQSRLNGSPGVKDGPGKFIPVGGPHRAQDFNPAVYVILAAQIALQCDAAAPREAPLKRGVEGIAARWSKAVVDRMARR